MSQSNINEIREDLVLNQEEVQSTIHRLACSIFEKHGKEMNDLVLAGIPTRGVEVARRILKELEIVAKENKITFSPPQLGVIDISMHRDDLGLRTKVTAIRPTELPLDINERIIIIVDDVAFTGRTCRAAMDALQSFGRPSLIEFAVLVDRGHRELPICPTYVGKVLKTELSQRIRVRFENLDGISDSVRLISA